MRSAYTAAITPRVCTSVLFIVSVVVEIVLVVIDGTMVVLMLKIFPYVVKAVLVAVEGSLLTV